MKNVHGWPLDGIKVVEYCQLVSGPFCGKMLAELGAEVVKVEPPLGDMARRRGPFPGDVPNPEKSALFLYLNTDKLGVTLNIETGVGRRLFLELLQDADVLIEDCVPGYLNELGIGSEVLMARNPKLSVTSITPFGQSGPYRDYKAYYLNTFHAGGEGYTLPGGQGWELYPDREPLRVAAFAGEASCGLVAAVATTVAITRQLKTGQGEHVDLSKQEALLHMLNRQEVARYPNEGIVDSRARDARHLIFLECTDGYLAISVRVDEWWQRLMDALGWPEWAKTEELKDADYRARNARAIVAKVAEWTKGKSKYEACHHFQRFGIPAGGVETAADILASPQLKARQYFAEMLHPIAGRLPYAGVPFLLSDRERRKPGPAPTLGQHNELILGRRLGYSGEELTRLRGLGAI